MRSKKPPWLIRPIPSSAKIRETKEVLHYLGLNTVCEEAMCPNIGECFDRKTVTFMIMGRICTRRCAFCRMDGGVPWPLEPDEPERVAEAVERFGSRHVIVTSVTRDDLPDGGAAHFTRTIKAIRERVSSATVEVLVPDFKGDRRSAHLVFEAVPDVFGHNIETVPRLYPIVRDQADYIRSLNLLMMAKREGFTIKTAILLGLGETLIEVQKVMQDLARIGCDILTIGQYLRPSKKNAPVFRYYPPDLFHQLQIEGLRLGIREVMASPFARSSYRTSKKEKDLC